MHPLMYAVILPDSRRVSREAARRHAILTAREEREDALTSTRKGGWTWFSFSSWRSHSSPSSA